VRPVKEASDDRLAVTASVMSSRSARPRYRPPDSTAVAIGGRPTPATEVLLMQSTIHAAHGRGHLSRHERQRRARAEAFSRRTPEGVAAEVPVKLGQDQLELIERLVRRDRTAVSSALLAIAGIGAGEAIRGAVLAQVSEAACLGQAAGTISPARSQQIARHVNRALGRPDVGVAS